MSSVVLVTGGAGFIGSHVVDHLLASGHRPRILDGRVSPWHPTGAIETVIGDVRRSEDVLRAARGCAAICHLAAAADVAEVHAYPAWATELNAMGTLNVLEAARQLEVRRVVYASTVWVYSDIDAEEVDEDELLPAPAHLYTAGKLTGELYCHSYAELYGVESTVLRFGIPYGPRARPAAVIPSFVDRALRGEPLTIGGTGEQERSFVYVEDLADGVVRALTPRAAGRTYNLAGRETTTIRALAEIVCEEVAPTEILHTEGRPGDLRGARVRSDRAEAELGWTATTPLREGVGRYAQWVQHRATPLPEPMSAAPGSAATGPRRALARLAGVAQDPVFAGVVALIAVASAAASVILGTPDRAQAADFTVAALALMLPLWSLTVTPWPAEVRRTQAIATVATGLFSVILLGVLSGDGDAQGDLHGRGLLSLVILGACLSGLLRVLPRRFADSSARMSHG
jgi:UDP-glucose 4-epimerase